jgi:hypothetical protein
MKTSRVRADEIIFKQGDTADRLYLIKQGVVGITTQIDLTTYRRTPIVNIKPHVNIIIGLSKMGNGHQY